MKFSFFVFIILIIHSCDFKRTTPTDSPIAAGRPDKNLDIIINPDTATLSKSIDTSTREALLIFTGRAISGKSILDEEFLSNREIYRELKRIKIFLIYVDEKKVIADTIVNDQKYLKYQMAHFHSAIHPHYIMYSDGRIKCESHYLNNTGEILRFLSCVE